MQDNFSIQEIVKATQGRLIGKIPPISFISPHQICTDTRNLQKGDLFVALVGGKFDGHQFVEESGEKGACGAIVSEPIYPPRRDFFLLQVKDTLRALQELARYHQRRLSLPLIAVTGSNGKTTVKEMIWQILSQEYPVLKSEGNFNNQIGVPLSLLGLSSIHKLGVFEMAMNSRGEIQRLAEIVEPRIGVITNIHHSHVGFLGSLEEIKEAKAELVPLLSRDPTNWLVLNNDSEWTPELTSRARCEVITFGIGQGSDVGADGIQSHHGVTEFTLTSRKGKIPIHLMVPGEYNVSNALAACAVALILGVPLPTMARVLSNFQLPPMHSQIYLLDKYKIIDDSYNANPESMEQALKLLKEIRGGRKVAILGDMLELGDAAEFFHYKIGRLMGELDIQALFALGKYSYKTVVGAKEAGIEKAFFFQDKKSLIEKLLTFLKENDCLLVKGSREMRMEEVIDRLRMRLCSST
ncbi:MAG: UDP-N-acetylmuramoyl-tripeptide--D-alanyl-D-alanine ligase [bacterium]